MMARWYRILPAIGALAGCASLMRSSPSVTPAEPVEATVPFLMPGSGDSVSLEVFVPTGVAQVRAVVAFVERGLDQYAYDDRSWRSMCARARCALLRLHLPRQDGAPPAAQLVRNAAIGGGAALLQALTLAAQRTHHPELREARIVLFGFSAAGRFGPTFASWRPGRTIGFIRYHSNFRGVSVDTSALVGIPALSIAGANDIVAGSDDARTLWHVLRSQDAPWAYVSHVGQSHLSVDGLVEAGPLMREWTEAVIESRVGPTAVLGVAPLARLRPADGWLLDDSTKVGAVAPLFSGLSSNASWVPNAAVAQELRVLAGLCAAVPLATARDILGADTRVSVDEVSTCRYTTGTPGRDLWVTTNRLPTTSAAAAQLEQARQAAAGHLMSGLGGAAFVVADSGRKCGTLGTAYLTRTFFVALCGEGFGTARDSATLQPLAQRIVGVR